jgi:hypothetical protein
MDVETVDTVHAFELFESIERHLASTSDKLQQLGQFFLVKRSDGSPEPLDLWRRRIVVVILSVSFPVVNVNVRETRDKKFQLLLVEDGDQLCRNNVMEA